MASSAAESSAKSSRESIGELRQKEEVVRGIRSHETALAELSSLSSSRGVYQKNGNLYFRTTALKATASEQKLLDQAKSRLKQLNA